MTSTLFASWHVVIIDNASSDGTQISLKSLQNKHPNLQVTFLDKNIGFGPANNLGFTMVEANYHILLNADAWLLANSILPTIEIMSKQKNIAICGLPLIYPDGSPQTYTYSFSSWHRWLLSLMGIANIVKKLIRINLFAQLFQLFPYSRSYVTNQKKPSLDISRINPEEYDATFQDVDWVCGAGMIISKSFIDKFGGFDTNIFLYGEDEDLCITAHNQGYRVITANVAPLVHMLGWNGDNSNPVVSDLKFMSLHYFIKKDIRNRVSQLLMKTLLPFYVYGYKRFYRAFTIKSRIF